MNSFSIRWGLLALGLIIWLSILLLSIDTSALILGYGHFFLIGLLGAIVANSTGSGGGIIFIPFFSTLGLSSIQALGTSIIIQCFGMTAGSLSWLWSMHYSHRSFREQDDLIKQLLLVCSVSTVIGVISAQYLLSEPDIPMVTIFRVFSVIFGIALLINALSHHKKHYTRHKLSANDQIAVIFVCFFGGMLVAWISIGVGEWIALYLIFRHYPTMVAICIGVCMSSIAVLAASFYHINVVSSVVWEVILFAAPAALVGGAFAKYLAFRLGPGRLKIFFGTWILVTGLIM